jgi:hypothetical protein
VALLTCLAESKVGISVVRKGGSGTWQKDTLALQLISAWDGAGKATRLTKVRVISAGKLVRIISVSRL